jgi:hypothetical protein
MATVVHRYALSIGFAIALAAWVGLALQALAGEPAKRSAADPGYQGGRIELVRAGAGMDAAPAAGHRSVLAEALRSGPLVTVSDRRLPAALREADGL